MHAFDLANEGAAGLAEIQANSGPSLLLALSLADVRLLRAKVLPSARRKGTVLFTQTQAGGVDLIVSELTSPNKALATVSKQHPDRVVAVVGMLQDFVEVSDEMEAIFSKQDFNKICGDRRIPAAAQPASYLLLMAKCNPPSEWAIEEIQEALAI